MRVMPLFLNPTCEPPGSYFVAKLVQGLLYAVGTIDPIVLIGVAVVLTSTACAMCRHGEQCA
jgi:hypothetical protein